MKIELKNIGPIREAEIELKPLTIILGANNTGKTLITQAVWEALRGLEPKLFILSAERFCWDFMETYCSDKYGKKEKSPLFESELSDNVRKMLGGYFKLVHEKDTAIRFISTAGKKGKFNIRLTEASSSARGLTDLYFFLKYKACEKQLLIINKPENNLDANNQIRMARLLVRCVRAGMRVLITTHSDYMIKEFNNLISLGNDFPEKKDFFERYSKDYNPNDYIEKESVAAYTCEKGSLTTCEIDYLGIRVPNMDKTIDKLNSLSNYIHLCVAKEES